MDLDFSVKLRALSETLLASHPTQRGLIGFDGFVDEIIDVVATRTSPDHYERIPTIAELARRIGDAAGLSTNLEMVPTQVKLGGNGPIMANALTSMGMAVTYIGCLGYPEIHPVFAELAEKCDVISVAEPGHTDALEFADGKVMLGKHHSLKEVRWDRIIDRISIDRLRQEAADAALIAALNWTMLPYLTEVWQHFLSDVLQTPPPGTTPPIAFFDLCDPAKREPAEIKEAVKTIERFRSKCRPILGLNRKEATEVADAIGLSVGPSNREAALSDITRALGESLDLHAVVVHPTHEAAVYTGGQLISIRGPYTSRPLLTTGAGDNFNAGFCLGAILGLSPEECLMMGKGVSGFYVRNRRSPSLSELAAFLAEWADNVGREF